jgi:phospholipid/cholesterol/gamma-HCH transport system permease protein
MMNEKQPVSAATTGFEFEVRENTVYHNHDLTLPYVEKYVNEILKKFRREKGIMVTLDLNGLSSIDSAGITGIYYIKEKLEESGLTVSIEGGSDSIRKKLETFRTEENVQKKEDQKISFLARIGDTVYIFLTEYVVSFLILSANVTYWSFTDIFKKKTHRKGEFYNQAVLIGVNAVYIVGILTFIIGAVLALQSAAQLRNFGANIFIVDLTVIAMMREMGPLITAILVAGRSGSSIAAEVATMKVTSELDALKTMAMNPIRFVIVPKMHGSLVTFPFLTILADVMGILGGMLIANFYLDISPTVFINRMGESLYNRDILIGIFKSFVFAGIIVMTGSFFGLKVSEGAEGVGKVTTLAVVVAISLVIIADSILGIIFY